MTDEDLGGEHCGTNRTRSTRNPGSAGQEDPCALRMRTGQRCLLSARSIRITQASDTPRMAIAHTVVMSTRRTAGMGSPLSGGRFLRSFVVRGLQTDASASAA